MKILMTGGTGFIGHHLLKQLIADNHEVTLLTRGTHTFIDIPNDAYLYLNFYRYGIFGLEEILKKHNYDCVIHLAAHYKVSRIEDDESIKEYYDSNVTFPIQLFSYAQYYGVKNFINTSSMYKWGNQEILPIKEDNQNFKPINLYAVTKLNFETFLKDYFCKQFDVKVFNLNLFSPYGSEDKKTKVVQQIIDSILNNKPIELSDGFQKLDWTYIDDVVHAYMKVLNILDNDFTSKYVGYTDINIASGKSHSVRDVVSILEEISEKTINKVFDPDLTGLISNSVADISKAKEILNWYPRYTLIEGLEETYNYYKDLKENGE